MTATLAPARSTGRTSRRQWLVPAGLILLSLIPVLAGSARLGELAGVADITADNARFFASPIPAVSHIVSATLYSLLGAFQFVPRLRLGRWHRVVGVLLIPMGLVSAVSGLWMTLFSALPASDNEALLVVRLVFGAGMLASILLGVCWLSFRDYRRHGAWMTRAYAIGVAAGTQALIMIGPQLATGWLDAPAKTVLMTLAWVINLGVAEYAIRRRPRHTRLPR